jgi:beta-lactamase regulating signal transducer with metallopeptidase domain
MIFLSFVEGYLVFHLLLIPVITLLGALVLLILTRLKRVPSAMRSGICGATLIVVLILPGAVMMVPKVTVPVFSGLPDAQTESLDRHLSPPGVLPSPVALSVAPAASSEPVPAVEPSNVSPAPKPSRYGFNWYVVREVSILTLVLVWLLGLAWRLGALTIGMAGITRLRWSSHRVTDNRLIEALNASRARLDYRGSVLFLLSDQIALPITWGWLRARIALPQDACHWPAERIDAALLHELAHIKRRDFAIQTLGRITCAVNWYNPLVLRLFRVWKSETEQACDDMVLCSGYSGERYGDILLEVWRGATTPRPQSSLGLAMVRASTLEQRVIAILDPEREREGVSPRRKVQLLAIFGGITVLIAGIDLSRPTNYHLTPELQNDMQAILRQAQKQEDAHLSLQMGLERQQEYWSGAKGAFEPQPKPTVADITLELTGMKARYRAIYHPSVGRWIHGAAPFYIESKTDVSDGENTWTILSEHHHNFKWKAGGDIRFLAGFGYRADDQVRVTIGLMEGKWDGPNLRFLFPTGFGSARGIERTDLNGVSVVRLQDVFTSGPNVQRRSWWFDPQRDYALVQYEIEFFNFGLSKPTGLTLTTVQQWQKVAEEVWYPTQFTTQDFRYENGRLTDDSVRSNTKITSLATLPTIDPAIFQTSATAAAEGEGRPYRQ